MSTQAQAANDLRRTAPASAAAPSHLHPVDLVRLLTVMGVIAVHVTAFTMPADDVAAGAALTVLHVTREVFLLLSAFVLAYSYRARPLHSSSFWRRRYPLIVVPYLCWTVVYVIADGQLTSPWHATATLLTDLVDGGARYHLYFLVVTLQLYAVFPWLLRAARRWGHRPRGILAASLAAQLAFAAAIHYRVSAPAPVSTWLSHPDALLPSYQLYIVVGVLAALYFEDVTAWLRRHADIVALAVAVTAVGGIASFAIDVAVIGMSPVHASEVFQPAVVLESVAFTAGQYVLGAWLVDRVAHRGRRRLEATADVSFGVYLAHPLLLQGALWGAAAVGLMAALSSLSSVVALAVALATAVPLIYIGSAVLITLARRSPISLAAAGRHRREAHVPAAVAAPPGMDSRAMTAAVL
jgi:peptidoglycan/LPS O-acetylase OafA/YrhL